MSTDLKPCNQSIYLKKSLSLMTWHMKKFHAFGPHDSILLHRIFTTSYIIISLSRYNLPKMTDDLSCSSPHMRVITLFSNLRICLPVYLFNLESSRTGSRPTVLSTKPLVAFFFWLKVQKRREIHVLKG